MSVPPHPRRVPLRHGAAFVAAVLATGGIGLPAAQAQSGGSVEPARREQPVAVAPRGAESRRAPNVEEARQRALLLHETCESVLFAMHRRYFLDDGRKPVPSRVLDDVFAENSRRSGVKARWMAVNAQVMTLGHEPQDEFERRAAKALARGEEAVEEIAAGRYRRAGVIPLSADCLKCHAPAPLRPDVTRVAALVIEVPVKDDAASSEPPAPTGNSARRSP
jgi:hypothetical protein